MVAYNGPKGETRWKLWIGSRNLTRSQDLDAGVLLDGSEKRAKGRVRLPGIGALGAILARSASREDADGIAEQLEAVWWDAPDGFQLRSLLNGLDEGVALPSEPPAGAVDGITIISPFLSPDFVKKAGGWGKAGSRTLISSMPALTDMARRPGKPLDGFSKILAYTAPDVLVDEAPLALPGVEPASEDDAEPAPLALHAKIFCFHSGEKTILRVGSANATERAWSGRNAEIMVELEAGEAFGSGLAFLIGKATPVTIEELAVADPPSTSAADALEESRKVLMASWNPVLRRDGERFSIDAGAVPLLAYPEHVLHAGPANGDLLAWQTDAVRLDLGTIPLSLQSAFIQARIYAFTPTTSFSSSQRLYGGKAVERAFIKLLLDELYPGLTDAFPEGYIEYGATSGWPWACEEAQGKFDNVSALFKTAYGRALRTEFGKPARENILRAIETSKYGQSLGRMRKALAQAALDSAPPDLVIFDEFQCYRELLDAGTDNPLARQLLAGNNGTPPPILLLSATPYRFYAERWENGVGAAPHVEFFKIIEFLGGSAARAEAETQFRRFGDLLHLIGHLPADSRQAAIEEAQALKHHLERLLTPLMSRTERPVSDHAGEPAPPSVRIEPHDLDVYRHFTDHVSPKLAGSAVSYWLSVPLPAQALGDRYQISRNIDFPATRSVPRLGVTNCFKPPKDGWGSAKLRALNSLVPTEVLALPWVLPSLTWWTPSGPWAKMTQSPKMLIFSRFRATPQSLAALVSLEVERKCVGKSNLPYTAAWKKRHLNPKPNQGPTLALFHPSPFLIRAVDPLDVKGKATVKQIRGRTRQQIIRALPASIAPEAPNARSNRRRKPAWAILAAIERAQKAPLAREFAAVQRSWGRVAPKDATLQTLLKQRQEADPITWLSRWELDALVDLALGAPGVVTGRALYRHLPELFDFQEQHFARLVNFCWTRLRTYLDRPVFWSVLPGEDATQKYQNACVDGCLEAVLDEHFWLRKSKVNPDGLIEDLSAALAASVGTFGFKGAKKKDKIRIRCHAAVPFGGTETETHRQDHDVDEPPPARSEEIRSAFNTPFWPHVLATTSVGQEGLDFHSWCDRLGHWDLCSSPVDLEQREGRVQRFGGLTVRQPLARKLGEQALAQARGQASSPWDIIARDADKAFEDDKTGLSPWWTMEGADLKRHLFALPQSRDIDRFAKLRAQRLLYRLALGQPDQEDLVELLTHHDVETTRLLQALTLDLSAFSREKRLDE